MKIVIAGNYGAQNIGDEMILEGMLEKLKDSEITVLSANPKETSEKFGVKSVPKFPSGPRSILKSLFNSKNETKKAVKECDIFILGGGGLFGSLTFKANIIWGIQAEMAYRYGKKIYMYGQSIGELKGWFRKWLVKRLFNKASKIAVRDDKSKKRLEKIGVKKEIKVIPDMAFNIKYEASVERKDREMVVALRQMKGLTAKFKETIAEFLNWLIEEKGWKVKFVDFQGGTGNEADFALHEEIIEKIRKKSGVEHLTTPKTSKEVLDIFAKSSFALTMRLHSIISAIKTSTPFLAINYAPKVEALLKHEGLEDRMVEMDEVEVGELKAQIHASTNSINTPIK